MSCGVNTHRYGMSCGVNTRYPKLPCDPCRTQVGEEILEPTAEKEPGGLQALSETLSAKDTFITVWPQGEEKLWASAS